MRMKGRLSGLTIRSPMTFEGDVSTESRQHRLRREGEVRK